MPTKYGVHERSTVSHTSSENGQLGWESIPRQLKERYAVAVRRTSRGIQVHRWQIFGVLALILLTTGNYVARLLGLLMLLLALGLLGLFVLPVIERRRRPH